MGANIFELSQKAREIYLNKANELEKRQLLDFVFLNLKMSDEKLVPTYQNGFGIVAERAKNENWLALLNTLRTYEWTKPYQPLDYSFKYMQQILYQ